MRYRLDVAYHGQGFHGWQKQPGLRTVQGDLEMWISRLLDSDPPIAITGAGRTDTGVHALALPAHFDSPAPIDSVHLQHRLRAALPQDMSVLRLHRVADDFHARYSAVARRYIYRIHLGVWPFDRDREWQVNELLDFGTLRACATAAMGRHDFNGFCRAISKRENSQCHITESRWDHDGDRLVYTVCADRFLHEMVRLMVGTFVASARGRWTPDHIAEILRSGDVRLCGDAAPPHGLTLEKVVFPTGVGDPVDFD